MTGKEMARVITLHKGPVYVAAMMRNDAPYVRAVKSDLVDYFLRVGNEDADCEWRIGQDGYAGYVDAN